MADIIEPRLLKGFRDFLPQAQAGRQAMVEKLEGVFRLYGFAPVDTPALEYAQILLGKGEGETEKQIYRFADNGGRDVALRFDLTVPFARFVAQHYGELSFPFKRYQIGKVWRGENAQRGRYREFTQCDFDIIGADSAAADFEILMIIRAAMESLGAGAAKVKISHRGLFNRFLARLGLQDASAGILRAVDKAAKTGAAATGEALAEIAGDEAAGKILDFTGCTGKSPNEPFAEALGRMTDLAGGPCPEAARLEMIMAFAGDCGAAQSFVLDPSITRGLDYYTGVVFETFLDSDPAIGSVCSGGRYGDLAGLYTKNPVSGVGASVGLDRLIAALENSGRLPPVTGSAALAVACLKEEDSGLYQVLADRLRALGISCEVFVQACENPVKQFVLAEKKGIKWVLLPGERPLEDAFTLRNLAKRKNTEGLCVAEAAKLVLGE